VRVQEGGHNIPKDVILRRYDNGLNNFFNIFKSIVDEWMFIDNSGSPYEIIAEGNSETETISNKSQWTTLTNNYTN